MTTARKTALVLGATSDIGRAIARHLAAQGYGLRLAARDAEQLAREAEDIAIRHQVPVSRHVFDVLAPETFADLFDGLESLPELAVCTVGLLIEQSETVIDMAAAERVMTTNYLGPARLLAELANRFEARGSGTIVGISSVAGDRGRGSNYVYGSAKAGFTAFLSGLRNRLAERGVHVVTVKPGFVYTRMTESRDVPARLTASTQEVAEAVWRAVERRRDVIYVRPAWRLIMSVIVLIPEAIFKKLKI